jgi:hypothetical protein
MSRDLTTEFVGGLQQNVVYPFFAVDINFPSSRLSFWTGYGDLSIGPDIVAGQIQVGTRYVIKTIGTTDFTLIGATSNTVGLSFVATAVGSGTGTVNVSYLGVGNLVNISSVEETTEIEAKGAVVTMSGIPSDFLSLALTQQYQGRECKIYFGLWIRDSFITTEATNIITAENLFEFVSGNDTKYLAEIFSGELDQMNILEEGATATISVTAENIMIKLERPVVLRFTNEDQKSRYPADKGLEFVAGLQDKEVFWGKASPQTNALTVIKQAVSSFRDR